MLSVAFPTHGKHLPTMKTRNGGDLEADIITESLLQPLVF